MKVLFVLRKKAGLTQTALASRTGLSQTEISLGENGYPLRRLDRIQEELRRHVESRDLVPLDPNDLLMEWDEYRERIALAKVS